MDWLRNLLNSNPVSIMFVPSVLSAFTFLGHLAMALSDGKIDSTEFHQLMSSANGIQMLILFGIMYALRDNK